MCKNQKKKKKNETNLHFHPYLIFTITTFAFDDEIIFRNGNKTTIKPNSFKVDYLNKSIRYTTTSNQQMELNFNEFESAEFGQHKFKIVKKENNILEGYFVLTETNHKKLLIKSELTEENLEAQIDLLILNHNNTIIEEYTLDSKTSTKNTTLRSEIYAVLKYHFPEYHNFLQRLELYDRSINYNNNTRILQFFKKPNLL